LKGPEKRVASPVRTCLGCGLKATKSTLVRLVLSNGALVSDAKGVLPGRGAYSCRQTSCFSRVLKQRKRLAWAMRCSEQEALEALAKNPLLDAALDEQTDVL